MVVIEVSIVFYTMQALKSIFSISITGILTQYFLRIVKRKGRNNTYHIYLLTYIDTYMDTYIYTYIDV